jgi:hypothetical protein
MRLTILILAAFLVGCDRDTSKTSTQTEKPDTRPPFVLDPSKPFVIEFGRGSGLQGLDIVKVDDTGEVKLSRTEGRQNAECTSLLLSSADVAAVVRLVNTNQLSSMGRVYSDPRIADGTQWVLWIEQSPSRKSIYFNNSFPNQITAFANGLDGLLQKAGLNAAKWSPLAAQQSKDQQQALWSRIKPAR